MTSKLVVNTIESDTGISSVSFASSISMSSTSKFFFGAAGIDIGADTNINRPAAGVLGFNINSSEKVRITSDGKIGINTVSPTYGMHLHGTTASSNAYYYAEQSTAGASAGFRLKTTGSHFSIYGATSGSALGIYDYNAGAERLTITSTGEIKQYGFTGSSDTSADDLVLGNTDSGVNRGITIWSHTSQNGSLVFADNDSNFRGAVQYLHNGDTMRLLTAGSERVRITSAGRFLVGVSTSNTGGSYSSVVSSGAAGNNGGFQAHFSGANNGGGGSMTTVNASGGGLDFWTYTGNVGASSYSRRLRIDSSGRVLVGTTDPGGGNADDLTVATSGNTGITIRSGTSNTGNIFFSDATSGDAQYAGAIEFHHSDNSLNLNVGNTAIVRIVKDSTTPAVGIGILPQAGQYNGWSVLQVGESAALTSNRTTADTNQTELSNNSYLNSNASAYKYHHADEATRYVQSHGRHTFYSAASGSADANITFSEVMKIDASGRVTKPYTPAFLAYHHGYDVNYGPNATLPYMHTSYNTGNHYNTSNSTFTAPVAGRYLFSANANGNYTSSYSGIPRAYWKINGSNVGNNIHLRGSDATHDGLEQRSQTVIFNLAANDTVKIVVGQNQWDLFGANSFTGYLIG